MSTRSRMGLGAVLGTVGALGTVLSLLLGWSAAPQPWGSLLAFLFGMAAGVGATLAVAGLIERRQGY